MHILNAVAVNKHGLVYAAGLESVCYYEKKCHCLKSCVSCQTLTDYISGCIDPFWHAERLSAQCY